MKIHKTEEVLLRIDQFNMKTVMGSWVLISNGVEVYVGGRQQIENLIKLLVVAMAEPDRVSSEEQIKEV